MVQFTVIVPIYNVDEYLLSCLQSIASQTYQNFECLLINDGATDNSAYIAKEFCRSHSQFNYYEKTNGGLSDARNYGMILAKGEYFVFIDSDDIIHFQFLEFAFEAITSLKSDLVYIHHLRFKHDNEITQNSYNIDLRSISKIQIAKYPNFACTRVCKIDLYDNNCFPIGFIYEDVVTSPILTYRAHNITEVRLPLYFYRRRGNSITGSSAITQFRLFNTLDELKRRIRDLNIPDVYYNTAFVNLSKSVIISLARIKDKNDFYFYLQLSWKEFEKLTFKQGLQSYSSLVSKLIFIVIKSKWCGFPMYFFVRFLLRILGR